MWTLARLGIPRGLHWAFFRGKLAILTYHGVSAYPLPLPNWGFIDAPRFRDHMRYLHDRFTVLPLRQAVERCRAGAIAGPTVAITFDDGYRNNARVAFPILRELRLPATIFLTTGLVDSERTVWDSRLYQAFAETGMQSVQWRGRLLDLSSSSDRVKSLRWAKRSLKGMPHPELIEACDSLIRALGREPDRAVEADSPFRMLSAAEVRDLVGSGLVEFGAHTVSHGILSKLPPAQQRSEISRSVSCVSGLTGNACRLFAFPNGGVEDYDERSLAELDASGVALAVTTVEGPNGPDLDPLQLRRYGVGGNYSLGALQMKVHHVRGRPGSGSFCQRTGPLPPAQGPASAPTL